MSCNKRTGLLAAIVAATLCRTGVSQAAAIFQADFNGPGNGTGGANDIVSLGGTGSLYHMTVASTTPFDTGTGGYAHYGTLYADGGSVALTPATAANSPQALTPTAGTDRVVNGGFDFFMRADHLLGSSEIRFVDIQSNAHGLRVFLDNTSSSNLRLYAYQTTQTDTAGLSPGAGDGAGTVKLLYTDAAFVGGFVANTVYHVAVGFTTDGNGAVTAKVWIKEGTGAINSADVAQGAVTFGIDENYITSGFRNNTFWVNGAKSNSPPTHDMDTFRLYDSVPTTFAALVIPEPASLGLFAVGTLLMAARPRR